MSVAAPLCVVAGSGATVAMLLGADAPAWLDAQGVEWLGVDAAGAVRETLPEQRRTRLRTAGAQNAMSSGSQPSVVVNCW